MQLINPRYDRAAPVTRPTPGARLTATQRGKLDAALVAIVDELPSNQPWVRVHDIVAALRAAVPTVAPDAYDGDDVVAMLRAAGYEVR